MAKLVLVTCLVLVGCSAPTVNNVVNTGGAAMKEKDTAMSVRGFAKMTPPSNGQSMGPKTMPKAGTTTIPIVNVDVYVFQANIDDDGSMETLYWAADHDTVFVWGTIDIVCVDEDDIDTGEKGQADFIYEADVEGYGWMVGTDSCGYSTLYGCSSDTGAGEVCGGCDWDTSFVVCTAE